MIFSKSCEYALQAVLFLALHPGRLAGIKEISSNISVPAPYLSKILQMLAKRRLLYSVKGPGGGFMINPEITRPTLLHVVEAVEGPDVFERCGIGMKLCNDMNPCPIHFRYVEFRKELKSILNEKTILEHGKDILEGNINFPAGNSSPNNQ